MPTDVYVSRKQITTDFKTIKDTEVVRMIDRDIIEYENILLRNLGSNLSQYTAREWADYIEKYTTTDGGAGIDFIAFCEGHIKALRAEGRNGTAGRFEAVIRNLTDYFGRSTVFVKEINVKNLQGFVEYMQKPHEQTRTNQHGKEVTVRRPGCKAQTAKDYLADLQTLFNAACDKYNDEDAEAVLITHRPFGSKKLQVEVKEEPEKRDLSEDDLVKILKYRDPDKRRLFSFYKMYANFREFNHNVNAGCKQLAAHLGIDVPLSTYYMRHTWATLASEECGISETDIALALNHVGVASGFESGKSLCLLYTSDAADE